MSLDDRARHELHGALEHVLGVGPADTLMAHLPPTGWGDVARKQDVSMAQIATSAAIAASTAELRLEMSSLAFGLHGEMAELRDGLRGEMAELRDELRGGMAELRQEISRGQQRLVLWFTTTMVALNSGLVGLVVALG